MKISSTCGTGLRVQNPLLFPVYRFAVRINIAPAWHPEIPGYVTPEANALYEFRIFNGIREMHSMSIFLSGPGAGDPHIWLGEKERERT